MPIADAVIAEALLIAAAGWLTEAALRAVMPSAAGFMGIPNEPPIAPMPPIEPSAIMAPDMLAGMDMDADGKDMGKDMGKDIGMEAAAGAFCEPFCIPGMPGRLKPGGITNPEAPGCIPAIIPGR